MKKIKNDGFTIVEIIIVVVAVAVIGTVGFFVTKHAGKKTPVASVNTSAKKSTQSVSASDPKVTPLIPATLPKSTSSTSSSIPNSALSKTTHSTSSSSSTTGSSGTGTGSNGSSGGTIYEVYSYDPIDYPSQPINNYCHNSTQTVTCPSGGEGIVVTGSDAYLNIPTGWSFNAGEYAYAYSGNKPAETNSNWNGQGNLALTKQHMSQTETLGTVLGSLVQN